MVVVNLHPGLADGGIMQQRGKMIELQSSTVTCISLSLWTLPPEIGIVPENRTNKYYVGWFTNFQISSIYDNSLHYNKLERKRQVIFMFMSAFYLLSALEPVICYTFFQKKSKILTFFTNSQKQCIPLPTPTWNLQFTIPVTNHKKPLQPKT